MFGKKLSWIPWCRGELSVSWNLEYYADCKKVFTSFVREAKPTRS